MILNISAPSLDLGDSLSLDEGRRSNLYTDEAKTIGNVIQKNRYSKDELSARRLT